MANAPALNIKNVSADYGYGPVITDINFTVEKGETFGLIGLNGVGKTTLIKIILGLLSPSAGSVEIFGRSNADPATKPMLSYLPEKFEPPHFLSGHEFIDFSRALYKLPPAPDAVLAAADRVSLARPALGRRVNTYSKGMRQKTGLLSVCLTDCPLLILDEPMSGLDPRARVQIKDELMDCKKRGMTVFMSSHILADMDEMCERVAVIDAGVLKFLGTPAALREQTQQAYLERAFLKIIEPEKKEVRTS